MGFDGPLNFASTNYLETAILARVTEFRELKHLVISGNGISEIDASGEETLRSLVDNLIDAKCAVSFSGFSDKIIDVLKRSHFFNHVGGKCFYRNRAQAISAIYSTTHADTQEPDCPYLLLMPPLVELSLHTDGSMRNAQHHSLRCCRHIAVLRFDGPLNFASAGYIEQEILTIVADRPALSQVVLGFHSVNRIDESGAEKLGELVTRLRKDGYAVSLSGLKEEVIDVLERTHVIETLGHENMFPTQVMAIAAIYARSHMGSSEEDCPLAGLAHKLTELSLHESGTLRDADQLGLQLCAHIAVLRFDGPHPLINRSASRSEFIKWTKMRSEVENIVFVGSSLGILNRIESENLAALVESVREAEFSVALTAFSDKTFESLLHNDVVNSIGKEHFFLSESQAVASIFRDAHVDESEKDCPLKGLLPENE
ncbi:MAG: sodium-independent anion transporter [Proteobacteria bacterium]|nr:sodium-independent anion transporter [Pseudomonadota bacterium]